MNAWITDLCDALRKGERSVIVTVSGVRGSAPRETGAKMIVTGNATIGSIGGGQLEYQCTRIAAQQLQKKVVYKAERIKRRFPLGTNCGQCCGGIVDVLFERVEVASVAWLEELRRLHEERHPVVLVTPLHEHGGKYLITENRCLSFDTADPCDEAVIGAARRIVAGSDVPQRVDNFLLEPVLPSAFHVAIFGAGHVGTATVDVLQKLDCQIRWVDSRRQVFPDRLPANVTAVETDDPAREVAAMPRETHYLVMTHSHPLDFDICDRVLRRGDFAYCGLIGSLSKRRRFERLMRKQAMPDALLDRLTCPIGVSGIESKKPADIAIAVAAELLQLRDAALAGIEDNDAIPENVRIL